MPNVVFVAPFFLDATLRFIDAVADTPKVRLGVVSQDPEDRLPEKLRAKLRGHYRIGDGLDPDQIVVAVQALARRIGPPDRLVGTLEQLQIPLAAARERLGLPGMRGDAALNFRDKARMKSRLREAGIPCARHRLVRSESDVWAFVAEVGYPLVAKPPSGAGAKATFRVDATSELRDVLAHLPPTPESPLLLEEFMTGIEHSFDSVCVDGRLVWRSINVYQPSPLEVLRAAWIQWCVLLPRETESPAWAEIDAVAPRALSVLGMETGFSHLEWFRRPGGGVAISEVAARPPGAQFMTLLSYAHDTDFYRAWARLMVHGEFTPPARPFAAGVAFFRGQGQGRVRAVHGLEEAQREIGPLVVEVKLPEPGQAASGSYEGDGYAILRHPLTEVVEAALKRVVSMVRVELG